MVVLLAWAFGHLDNGSDALQSRFWLIDHRANILFARTSRLRSPRMPANLTHNYLKAEREYRAASTPDEELCCLQAMLREVPKHKGTDRLQADLKHKISLARKELQSQRTSKTGPGVRIPRQGAGRVVLVGGPNSGRSQFVAHVTRAEPLVADYPFTTREPLPAMMPWQDIAFQLIDTQPITCDVLDPNLQGLIRGSDLVLLFLDLASDDGYQLCRDVVDKLGATKTRLGTASYLDQDDIGRSYTQTLLVLSKIDWPDATLRWELFREDTEFLNKEHSSGNRDPTRFKQFRVSSLTGAGIDELQQAIFDAIGVVRVYTKLPTAKVADFEKPFTLRSGGTVRDVAALVHRDFPDKTKSARIWRGLTDDLQILDGVVVKPDYVLSDQDIVELHVT